MTKGNWNGCVNMKAVSLSCKLSIYRGSTPWTLRSKVKINDCPLAFIRICHVHSMRQLPCRQLTGLLLKTSPLTVLLFIPNSLPLHILLLKGERHCMFCLRLRLNKGKIQDATSLF